MLGRGFSAPILALLLASAPSQASVSPHGSSCEALALGQDLVSTHQEAHEIAVKALKKSNIPFERFDLIGDAPVLELPVKDGPHFLSKAAYELGTSPEYRTGNYDNVRVRISLDPHAPEGYFNPETGGLEISWRMLGNEAALRSTLQHEIVHAREFSRWMGAADRVDSINISVKATNGTLPLLEKTGYEHGAVAQELPAFFKTIEHSNDQQDAILGMKLALSFHKITVDTLARLTPASYSLKRFSNLKPKTVYAEISGPAYRVNVPLTNKGIESLSSEQIHARVREQLEHLRDAAKQYALDFRSKALDSR